MVYLRHQAEGSRPMTRGGLGLKTAGTGGRNRAVMDKSYFMGVLRTKITEMTAEIRRMAAECDKMGQDQDNFVIYDTRAKEKANELNGKYFLPVFPIRPSLCFRRLPIL